MREVRQLLVRGLDDTALCISIRTVVTHRAQILKKTRPPSRSALVRLAACTRLVTVSRRS